MRKSSLLYFMLIVLLLGCTAQQPAQPDREADSAERVQLQTMKDDLTPEPEVEAETQDMLPANIYGREDPFAQVVLRDPGIDGDISGGLRLGGLIVGGGQPLAMINDKVVAVGEVVDGKKVVKIEKESVVLEDEAGGTQVLKFIRPGQGADL
ncbi:MAG: hypothetical protein GY853_12315 [PVC group bacterium]|nr:hypothetical protein [PVC group bacterium]